MPGTVTWGASTLREIVLRPGADAEGFRRAVRGLIAAGVQPRDVVWSSGGPGLFDTPGVPEDAPAVPLPRPVAETVRIVVCHNDAERYGLLYRLIWRVVHGERQLIENPGDPLVHKLGQMAKSVRRDIHKMHAFVRFREVPAEEGEARFVAWFEPEHFILEAVADFFIERFPSMRWSILTPIGSLIWDGERLDFGPPASRRDAPAADGFEEGWLGYYESTFNPARANPTMMRTEMPKKYWPNLPEARIIPRLLEGAAGRVDDMLEREAALPRKRDPVRAVAAMARQEPASLDELNRIIMATPPFVSGGTRAVLGEGPMNALLALVGEQPGDQEDLEGRPFVGPAGQLLMKAMAEAGIAREATYLTNAVKHFKFVQRGKRRLHQKPTTGEVKHYRWWLEKELELVHPRLVVALGGTAALALTGQVLPVTRERGARLLGRHAGFVSVHPSYILRLPDQAAQAQAYAGLVADLGAAKALAEAA